MLSIGAQESVEEENVVEMIADFAALVDMTEAPVDQSQRNFDVILNVLNTTSSIVSIADFNDTDLGEVKKCLYASIMVYFESILNFSKVVHSVSRIVDNLQIWEEDEVQMTDIK